MRNSKHDKTKFEGNSKYEIRKKSVRATAETSGIFERFWEWAEEPKVEPLVLREDGTDKPVRDLLERTAVFGERVVQFAKKVPQVPVTNRLITQLVGAGTSVGANFCEANDAVSRKDFKLKIGISRKESKETMFFLRMVAAAEPTLAEEARSLWREAKELNLILGAIWRK